MPGAQSPQTLAGARAAGRWPVPDFSPAALAVLREGRIVAPGEFARRARGAPRPGRVRGRGGVRDAGGGAGRAERRVRRPLRAQAGHAGEPDAHQRRALPGQRPGLVRRRPGGPAAAVRPRAPADRGLLRPEHGLRLRPERGRRAGHGARPPQPARGPGDGHGSVRPLHRQHGEPGHRPPAGGRVRRDEDRAAGRAPLQPLAQRDRGLHGGAGGWAAVPPPRRHSRRSARAVGDHRAQRLALRRSGAALPGALQRGQPDAVARPLHHHGAVRGGGPHPGRVVRLRLRQPRRARPPPGRRPGGAAARSTTSCCAGS